MVNMDWQKLRWMLICLAFSIGCALKTTSTLNGEIVTRQEQTVTATLKQPNRATVGAKYQVVRKLPITHPVTGEILKTELRQIGEISVREVKDDRFIATIVAETTPIQAGDLLQPIKPITQDKRPPTIQIINPAENAVVTSRTRLEAQIADNVQVSRVTLNEVPLTITPAAEVLIEVALPRLTDGVNTVTIEASDTRGNTHRHTLTVRYAPVRIAVLPFDLLSNGAQHNTRTDAVTQELTTALSLLPDIQLYSAGVVKQALQPLGVTPTDMLDLKGWRTLQTRLQLKWLILGNLRVREEEVEIQVGVVNLGTGEITPHGVTVPISDAAAMQSAVKSFAESLLPTPE
jgi:TolB-like protein